MVQYLFRFSWIVAALLSELSIARLRLTCSLQKHVDILVNAAGISVNGILPKTELEDISRILRTNLQGSILTSRALMRAAIRARIESRKQPAAASTTTTVKEPPRSKCIINISSLLATKGGTGAVTYAASKAGILGLTRAVTAEAATSLRDVVIRSNAIVPGYIETPMIAGMPIRLLYISSSALPRIWGCLISSSHMIRSQPISPFAKPLLVQISAQAKQPD